MQQIVPLLLLPERVEIIDQTCLPGREILLSFDHENDLIEAICRLQIRGAPALGGAGAAAGYLAARRLNGCADFRHCLEHSLARIANARPTAVNLSAAVNGLRSLLPGISRDEDVPSVFFRFAQEWVAREVDSCDRMSEIGADLLAAPGLRVMTVCNTGALATLGIGTALGVIRRMHERHPLHVWVTETRPLLQGARLTTWELDRLGIPFTLLTDSMAASLMAAGKVDIIFAGADRIAVNGDTANKIGTLSLAALSRVFHIPFYVVAPETTIDPRTPDGSAIPIEHRAPEEVRQFRDSLAAPPGCEVYNPAFDVTPGDWITGIITDKTVHRSPYQLNRP